MPTSDVLYLVGRPAAGKSTLAAHLCRDLTGATYRKPFAHRLLLPSPVVALGADRAGFPGTDTLGMGVAPTVLEWIARPSAPRLVLGEGDRLASLKLFDQWRAAGVTVTVASVEVDDDTLEARRSARSDWTPAASWLAGRDTKAARLADTADVTVPGDDLDRAQALLDWHPVVVALEAAR